MEKYYTQLAQYDRVAIDHILVDRCSKVKIAKHLGVHVCTRIFRLIRFELSIDC